MRTKNGFVVPEEINKEINTTPEETLNVALIEENGVLPSYARIRRPSQRSALSTRTRSFLELGFALPLEGFRSKIGTLLWQVFVPTFATSKVFSSHPLGGACICTLSQQCLGFFYKKNTGPLPNASPRKSGPPKEGQKQSYLIFLNHTVRQ